LLIVKPETLLRWHQHSIRLFWKRKSRVKPREPKISVKTVMLIMEIAANNQHAQ
jgi:hypothetical protein